MEDEGDDYVGNEQTRGDTIPEESRFTIPDFRGIGPLRGGLIPKKESILFKESRFTIPFFEESCHLYLVSH